MRSCALLTTDVLDGFVSDDELVVEPLALAGFDAQFVSWRRRAVDWDRFDVVVIRTPWDYQQDVAAFLAVLDCIERSSARLFNPLEIVRWNVRKTYLSDLEAHGVPIVPTIWDVPLKQESIAALFDRFGADEIVVKPIVSANADHTYRVRLETLDRELPALTRSYRTRPFLAQPFLRSFVTEGEFSLFYFAGAFSHAILKTPKSGDFRVQEEHGGIIKTVAATAELRCHGRAAMVAVGQELLYGRVDLVREGTGFAVVELELIEPSLYFRMDPEAPDRFARALAAWVDR